MMPADQLNKCMIKIRLFVLLFLFIFFLSGATINAATSSKTKSFGDAKKPVSTSAIKKLPSSLKTLKPDLIVKDVGLSSDCRIKFTVENYSKINITDAFHGLGSVKVRVTGKPSKNYSFIFRTLDPGGLLKRAGGKITYTSTVKLTETTSVKVDVDPLNKIPETNETNNSSGTIRLRPICLSTTISNPVAAFSRPDLTIYSFTRTPENPDTEDEITFSARVKNQGPGVSRLCKLSLQVGGEGEPPEYTVPALASGATYTVRRDKSLGVAQYYRSTVKVDIDNQNIEEDETNNEQIMEFQVSPPARPDLTILSFDRLYSRRKAKDGALLKAVVKNIGEGSSAACRLEFKTRGESKPLMHDIPALAPGATYTVSREIYKALPLNYKCRAKIDADNAITELNEENNEKNLSSGISR